jgi:hypothetical protein
MGGDPVAKQEKLTKQQTKKKQYREKKGSTRVGVLKGKRNKETLQQHSTRFNKIEN